MLTRKILPYFLIVKMLDKKHKTVGSRVWDGRGAAYILPCRSVD